MSFLSIPRDRLPIALGVLLVFTVLLLRLVNATTRWKDAPPGMNSGTDVLDCATDQKHRTTYIAFRWKLTPNTQARFAYPVPKVGSEMYVGKQVMAILLS